MAPRCSSVLPCGWPYSFPAPTLMSASRGFSAARNAGVLLESDP